MMLELALTDEPNNTQYAPLAALLWLYRGTQRLAPLGNVKIRMQSRTFTPVDKLIHVLISILSGCTYLSEINTRLRLETALAQVGAWSCFAEQSGLQKTLDQLSLMNLSELRSATQAIWRSYSGTLHHDWRGFLWLDLDLTGLPCGEQAEGSTKGYFSAKKNIRGRQLARVSALRYRETLWSQLYPGNRNSSECLEPMVRAIETVLDLAPSADAGENALDLARRRRKRVLWRLDAGFGTFKNLQWLLERQYQVVGKGNSSNCARRLAKSVTHWTPFEKHWLAPAPCPFATDRRVTTWLLRRHEKTGFVYNYFVTTLRLPSLSAAMQAYQQRGGAEIEQFRNDKQGLHLSMRRKRGFLAQEGLVLLTDLAHNLLADFHTVALTESRFSGFGLKRIVRDLLNMPGTLSWLAPDKLRVALLKRHPYAPELLNCLVKYSRHYAMPTSIVG